MAGHDMAHMQHGNSPADREGSGTAWLPDATPMYAIHGEGRSGWSYMTHGNVFLQYLYESGDRGSEQTGSVNWIMGMADHGLGGGRLRLSGMVSFENWSIGGCGYPDLLASGENCDGNAIHDRQHPHDLFMEAAVMYDRPLGGGVNLQLYGAPVGEPALGPVAFMHRTSAIPNPIAPISHHWFDSTHITYGVVTTGLYGNKWKLEASAFNGREPDEERTDFDFDTMDSWSGRLWYLPTKGLAFQVSGGRLREAEQHEADEPRIDVERWTASATYHYTRAQKILWATTLGWGRNKELGEEGGPTDAFLIETNLTFADRDSIFARLETALKTPHDLDVEGDGRYQVHKVQIGYNRYLANWGGLKPGIGVAGSAGIVPRSLVPVYGERWNPGGAVYITLRPAGRSPE